MSTHEDLVPVFIPTLGALLLRAEDTKRSPLTEAEVTALRDKASVIMMRRADAEKMDEKRGYKDVDPDNLWHDWQTLRDALGRKPALPRGARLDYVKTEDPALQQAASDARANLARFTQLASTLKGGHTFPMFKTRVNDDTAASFMWLRWIGGNDQELEGEFFEVPSTWKRHRIGDRLHVPCSAIFDWAINNNGQLHGGYSLRVARARKPEAERPQFDSYIGVNTYLPLP